MEFLAYIDWEKGERVFTTGDSVEELKAEITGRGLMFFDSSVYKVYPLYDAEKDITATVLENNRRQYWKAVGVHVGKPDRGTMFHDVQCVALYSNI